MKTKCPYFIFLITTLLVFACGAAAETVSPTAARQSVTNTLETTTPPTVTLTPSPQPSATRAVFSPQTLPNTYNPLSAQPVEDVSLLNVPALLISISHFPPTARPQAGLSFAPWVFEYYITEGATRFLAVFYGKFPKPETPVTGNCEVRSGAFLPNGDFIGNRVWLDEDENGIQDSNENGVGGICVNLYDASGALIDSTTTDSNGYYGFNITPAEYSIGFDLPGWLTFTTPDVGDDDHDSDVNPLEGRISADARGTRLDLDVGLIPLADQLPTPDSAARFSKPEVGPIRSGRLIYADIAAFFPRSCLIYAFASYEVLDKIPGCSMVAHEDAGGGSMMDLERMKAVADDNMRRTRGVFNYASNSFSDDPPQGGMNANQINIFVAALNQSGWTYDPLYGAWLRFVDKAEKNLAGQLFADSDRLTQRQIAVENFIIIIAEHDVVSPTNLDIHLEQGGQGMAYLFRDGMKYDIRWTTRSTEYEKQTATRQPMHFINADGSPAQLKPGHTWIFVASPYSIISDEGNGIWKLRYYPPAESK